MMSNIRNYYATAVYYTASEANSGTIPALNRFFLFVGFDAMTIRKVNEASLKGEWTLMNGKREFLDFTRRSVTDGPELSNITQYTGQVHKRTPLKKTFVISQTEFLQKLLFTDVELQRSAMLQSEQTANTWQTGTQH